MGCTSDDGLVGVTGEDSWDVGLYILLSGASLYLASPEVRSGYSCLDPVLDEGLVSFVMGGNAGSVRSCSATGSFGSTG